MATARPPSRAFRLSGTGAFDTVFRTGQRSEGRYLQLVAAPAAHSPGRVGYVMAAKTMKRAVDRNRLRRRLRELVRQARPAIERYDIILRVKRTVNRIEQDAAHAEAVRLLSALLATSAVATRP